MSVLITGIRSSSSGVAEDRQETPGFQDSSFGQNAFNSERPLNVKPTSQGGVSIDGREDLPEGHANIADKMIGKIQKVIYLLFSSVCSDPTRALFRRWLGRP